MKDKKFIIIDKLISTTQLRRPFWGFRTNPWDMFFASAYCWDENDSFLDIFRLMYFAYSD